jgi:hypothetical protein
VTVLFPDQRSYISDREKGIATRLLFGQIGGLQAASADPFEDGAVLIAGFVSVPALAAVVGGEVVADVAGAVGWAGGLDDDQALVGVGDVYNAHGVFIVFYAGLVGEDALCIGWNEFEDDMAGVAEDAGFTVGAGLCKDGLDHGDEVAEVEYRAGLDIV